MAGPFEGIIVLELSRTLAWPFCDMKLADMSPEVIKERSRSWKMKLGNLLQQEKATGELPVAFSWKTLTNELFRRAQYISFLEYYLSVNL